MNNEKNRNIEICQRQELWALIKNLHNHYKGNETEESLKNYAREITAHNSFETLLLCFRSLTKNIKK